MINREHWQAPLYWVKQADQWFEFTLSGLHPLDLNAPVTHLSYYEADAYANWVEARLPSEFEWEIAAQQVKIEGDFVENQIFHPRALSASTEGGIQQLGDVWEWTRSPSHPTPGFKAAAGAVGEYNGKFMSSQLVLRGALVSAVRIISAPPIETFSTPIPAGNSWVYAWPVIRNRRNTFDSHPNAKFTKGHKVMVRYPS